MGLLVPTRLVPVCELGFTAIGAVRLLLDITLKNTVIEISKNSDGIYTL